MIDISRIEFELNELFRRNINEAKYVIKEIFEIIVQNDVSATNTKYLNIYKNYIEKKVDKSDSLNSLWAGIEGCEEGNNSSEILGRMIVTLIREKYDPYDIDLLLEFIESNENSVTNEIIMQIVANLYRKRQNKLQ